MTQPTPIFLLGAGYLGRQIIDDLLLTSHPITTLLRNKDLAATLSASGVTTHIGSLSDHATITSLAAQHATIINTSSSDDVPSVLAILEGIRQRVAANLPTTFLHTSGTGLLVDTAKGRYLSSTIYSDDNPAGIDALPSTAMHRDVDLAIVAAAREFGPKANIAIMIPPIIYGVNPAHGRVSMGLPPLVRFALKHGFSGRVNEAKNAWSAVHVRDLSRAYILLASTLPQNVAIGGATVQENPYFFADNGYEFSWAEAAENVGRILHKLGKIESAEVREFGKAELGDVYGPATELVAGGNARCRSTRLPALGWVPREKGVWDAVETEEAPFLIQQHEAQKG
jgi:nucleoside-diphosphate-sugar epimerase